MTDAEAKVEFKKYCDEIDEKIDAYVKKLDSREIQGDEIIMNFERMKKLKLEELVKQIE